MKNLSKKMYILFIMIVSISVLGNVKQANAAEAAITPAVITTGSEDVTTFANHTYTVPAKLTSAEKDTAKTVVPITVANKGALYISVNSSQVVNDIKISLWSDANCIYTVGNSSYFTADPNAAASKRFEINTPGTYYMSIEYLSYSQKNVAGSVNLTPYFISRADTSLAANTWIALAPKENNIYRYLTVNIAKAGYIGITQTNTTSTNMTVALCKDTTASSIVSKNITTNYTNWYPVEAGTYYIKTEGAYNARGAIKWEFATNFTAKRNTPFTINPLGEAVFDVKIKAEKTGLLTLSIDGSESAYITFLNSKKKALSKALWNWGSTSSIAVQKGKTYYIRVNASIGDDARNMTYTIDGASTKKNTSKKKATTLKAKKTNKSIILAGDTKWHYFKFKLTKSKKLNMTFKVEGNGNFKYEVLKSSKKIYTSRNSSKGTLTTSSKLSKGTYYLRIKMADKKSSGRITLKLK